MKKILARILVITLLIANVCIVSAESNTATYDEYNMEKATGREVERFFYIVTKAIITNNSSLVDYNWFTTYEGNLLNTYILNNDIGGELDSMVVDFTYPNNSATGDTVVMVNVKVNYENGEYNKVYLFEYHIDSNGKIYGHNVWVY